MARSLDEKTVLVTGGSGYLAGWTLVELLKKGYQVRTTLRALKRKEQVETAVAKQTEIAGRLSFVEADLLSDTNWDQAVSGCDYVIHVASPMGQGEPKADLVRPAREGTLRVLRAASKAGVQRVVYTSSTVAAQAPDVPGEAQPQTDETTWTDPGQKGLGEYPRSKTLAELAAWDFMQQDGSGMTLATVLPGMIIGPVMANSVSGSLEVISRLLTGKVPATPRIGFRIGDVQQLADLHIRAMTNPAAANQRFLGVGGFLWMSEIAATLRAHFGERAAKVTTRRLPDTVLRFAALFQHEARFMAPMLGKRREFNVSKVATLLGWTPRPAKEVVIESGESLFQRGLIG